MINMEDIVSKIFEEVQQCEESQLIQDIIRIYNHTYNDYENYLEEINSINKRIDEFENFHRGGTSFYYQPKHKIISEKSYNFIIGLSKIYHREVEKNEI